MFAQKEGCVPIDTIYFGGGTPSHVDSNLITETLSTLKKHFDIDKNAEITIEINPESVNEKKMNDYAANGINRISIGLQAAQNRLLKKLGRAHSVEEFKQAVRLAERAGIDNLSADLMFGLPNQTIQDLDASIEMLLAIPIIRHLSCYSLKIEPGTVFDERQKQGRLRLPSEDLERAMQYHINRRLASAGLRQYEISNYAFPGYESRHNSRYWTLDDYLGFGLGAASCYKGKRFTNTFDFETYVHQSPVPREEEHVLSSEEEQSDFMFLGLRMNQGVCDEVYQERFGHSFFQDYQQAIDKLLSKGLIQQNNSCIYLTESGRDFANQVFLEFV